MNLLSLRYFVVIAEQSSFTKAAELLFVTQPTLSRQVQDLEEELGVQLFIRNRHSVSLTDAGANLLVEAKDLLKRFDDLPEVIRRSKDGTKHTLSIGYQRTLNTEAMYSAIKILRKAEPSIDFRLMKGHPSDLALYLQEGQCDIVFALGITFTSLPNVECMKVLNNTVQLVVPQDHRFASRDSVHLTELANERFILLERAVSPPALDYMMAQCIRYNFSLRACEYAADPETAVLLVSAGMGVSLINSRTNIRVPENVKLLNIDGFENEGINFVAAYKTDNPCPALSLFVSTIREHIAEP